MRRTLAISTRGGEGVLRISASGEVDMDSSPRLLEAIRAGLKDSPRVELDLKEVGYMDSSGIAVLVQGLKLARRLKADYSILDPSPQVMAVIELSQLADFFAVKRSGGAE